MMPGFLQSEIKYSFRMLRKQPSFALAAIGIMALGIGATTMVFSIVYTVLLRSLPYRDPGRLAAIEGNFEVLKMANIGASPREYLNYRSQSKAFEQIAAFSIQSSALTGGDRPENIQMSRVSDNLLELLGIDPSKGRAFSQDDYQSPEVQTAIISDSLWTRHFGRAEDIIGQTIRLDGTP
ncbi:MAG TPA: ABC transporter permease, partial [Blastocatellia bacterium]|nr:ABC transporter permease [Blastocatellia bacterium]